MLDQNTDRMWFVIGALVVGASIILLANKTMPQLFASVADTFKDMTDEVSEEIASIQPAGTNPLHKYLSPVSNDGVVTVDREGINSYIVTSDGAIHGGMRISSDALTYGEPHRLSFDIETLSGHIDTIGGHLTTGQNTKVYIDGEHVSNEWMLTKGIPYPNDMEMHHIVVEFTPFADTATRGGNPHVYIQPNRSGGSGIGYEYYPYTARLSNIVVETIR